MSEAWKSALYEFSMKDPSMMARSKGGYFNQENQYISLRYLGHEIWVYYPTGHVVPVRDLPGGPLTDEERILILQYLSESNNSTGPSAEWLSFIQLVGGELHAALFQSDAADPLAQAFGHNPGLLFESASRFDSRPFSVADAAIAFRVFPKVTLGAVLWAEDDEFPARATMLIDAGAQDHLTTARIYMLGIELSKRLQS